MYVLGDGKLPLCAAAIRLAIENNSLLCRKANMKQVSNDLVVKSNENEMYGFNELTTTTNSTNSTNEVKNVKNKGIDFTMFSIDPLLEISHPSLKAIKDSKYGDSFFMFKGLSQNFVLPKQRIHCLSIVVGCHSHAPLHEFWQRMPMPRIAVVMPCCKSSFSNIPNIKPVFEYTDFDVISPKRKIKIYADV